MNAKRAKKLRKQAEAMTIGKAERAYVTIETEANPNYSERKFFDGEGGVRMMLQRNRQKKKNKLDGVVFVHPETTRGVYKAMKAGRA